MAEFDDDKHVAALAALIRKIWRAIALNLANEVGGKHVVTFADVDSVPTRWMEALESQVLSSVETTYREAASFVAQAVDASDDMLIGDDIVVEYLDQARNRLSGIGDDVWHVTRAQIKLGLESGESVQEIAARVKNTTGVSSGRALTIARTETHAAYESGAFQQALFVDPDGVKTWLATNDERTRETHRHADGQTVKINESFVVGGTKMRFPGDPMGDPSETINCRCATTYSFGDIITNVSDETSSDKDLVVTAAGKRDWDPKSHPRGKDGKFIKKGTAAWLAVATDDPNDAALAVKAMKQSEWDNLTSTQKDQIAEKVVDSDATGKVFNEAAAKLHDLDKGIAGEESSIGKAYVPKSSDDASVDGPQIYPPDFSDAISEVSYSLTSDDWKNLPPSDKKFLEDQVNQAVKDGKQGSIWAQNMIKDLKAGVVHTTSLPSKVLGKPVTSPPKPIVKTKKPAKKFAKFAPSTKSADIAPSPLSSPTLAPAKIPDGLKGKPGDPAKITTGVIWGKHAPGTVIVEADHGTERIVWNGKKYEFQGKDEDGAWSLQYEMTKKDAYAQLKQESQWVVPGAAQQTQPTSAVAPTTPKLTAPKLGEKAGTTVSTDTLSSTSTDADVNTTPYVATSIHDDKTTLTIDDVNFLLGEMESGDTLTVIETNELLDALGPDGLSQLSTKQFNSMQKTIDGFKGVGKKSSIMEDSIKKWDAFQQGQKHLANKDQLSPAGKAGILQPATGPVIKDIVADLKDIGVGDHDFASGDIVAVSDDNQYRLTYSASLDGIIVEQNANGEWQDIDSFSLDPGGFPPMDESIETFMLDYGFNTWKKPTPDDVVHNPGATPITHTKDDIIENWDGVLSSPNLKVNDVVAFSTDGNFRIVVVQPPSNDSDADSSLFSFEVKKGSDWEPYISNVSSFAADELVHDLADTWAVPSKKPITKITLADLPDDKPIPTTTLFDLMKNPDVKSGDVLAHGMLPTAPYFEYKAVVVNGGILEIQGRVKNSDYGKWSALGSYKDKESFNADWKKDLFVWVKPPVSPTDTTAPSVVPTTSVSSVPTSSVTAPPIAVATGDDISQIPAYHITSFKNTFKAQNNTGYWSKPEKIWDAVKDIQDKYPDPNSPGHSKYTPLQILKALDSVTNTKTSSAPYSSKIEKWASTYKGMSYIKSKGGDTTLGGSGVMGTSKPTSVTAPKTPKELASGVFAAINSGQLTKGDFLFVSKKPDVNGNTFAVKAIDEKIAALVQTTPGTGVVSPQDTISFIYNDNELAGLIETFDLTPSASVVGVPTIPTSTTPTPSVAPPPVSLPDSVDIGTGDISHLSDTQKNDIFTKFKAQSNTYLDSPAKNIFAALKTVSESNGLSILQTMRAVDAIGAEKAKVQNGFLFEKKITEWLKTPKGIATATGAPLPKPPRPAFKKGLAPSVPPLEVSDQFQYNTISVTDTNSYWKTVTAQHGAWTNAESAAIKAYTGGIYYSINSYLYGENDSLSSTNMTALTNAQKAMRPSTKPLLLHRGVGFSGLGNAKNHDDIAKMVGQTWKNDGFSSTSVGGAAGFGHMPVIMEIEAPPGTMMAWARPVSYYKNSNENEMLLAAGTNYKIISAKQSGGKTIVRVRVVPDEGDAQ